MASPARCVSARSHRLSAGFMALQTVCVCPCFCRIISALSQNRVAWGLILDHVGKGRRAWWLSWNRGDGSPGVTAEGTASAHVADFGHGVKGAPHPLCFSVALLAVSLSVSVKVCFY